MNRIRCVICTRWKAFSDDRLQANIAKFGSISTLEAKYQCRNCRGLTVIDDKIAALQPAIYTSLKQEIEKEVTSKRNLLPEFS